LKLGARVRKVAAKVKRGSQNGVCQRNCDRILHSGNCCRTAFCALEGGSEIAGSQVEHIERTQQPRLIERVAAFFCDREASLQGYARRIASSPHEHQRHAEGCLKMHLVESAKS